MRKTRVIFNSGKIILSVMVMALYAACSKPPEPTPTPPNPNPPTPPVVVDPGTGQPIPTLSTQGGDCMVVKISQRNGNTGAGQNAFEVRRDGALGATGLSLYDSLTKKQDYNITATTTGDSIGLSTGEYFLLDKTTKQVVYFSTRIDPQDAASDKQVFRYVYDANGFLVQKRNYINGSALASYETQYTYSGNTLTGCTVTIGGKKLIESVLAYDMSTERKDWIYLFPDFFEGYHYLQAFPFGKRGKYPLTSIVTKIYDTQDGTLLDTWSTNFSGYVFSTDNFILQATATGDQQQGIGVLFNTIRFTYQCNK